jgi:predicted nucleic acid-binding protein
MIVLDASALVARVVPSQATAAADAFFAASPLPELIAPAIFSCEVRSALLRAERAGFADREGVNARITMIDVLVKVSAFPAGPAAFAGLVALARAERLSLFDASYLDLALRERASIASRDGPLLGAAARRGLAIHDLR